MKYHEKVCLIDGDIILYNVAWGNEKEEFAWNVKYSVYQTILSILAKTQTSSYIAYITGSNNFRKQIDLPRRYKANRKTEKPKWFKFVKETLINELGFIVVDNIEADDAISLCSKSLEDFVICTIDKDLMQIPGQHYNFITDTFVNVTEQEAEKFFWTQMLTGDPIDNVEGIRGMGPKKVHKLFSQSENYRQIVFETYIKYYGEYKGIEYFYKHYVLLRLLAHYPNFEIPIPRVMDALKPVEYYIGVPKLNCFKNE
jgi:5'-3' exonuclease